MRRVPPTAGRRPNGFPRQRPRPRHSRSAALVLAAASALAAGCRAQDAGNSRAAAPPPLQEYTVDWLRARTFAPAAIAIERDLGDKGGFRSYVASYPSDGLKLFALMDVPAGPKPASGWPVVVVSHGYIPPQAYSTIDSYHLICDTYARAGFLVLKPDYRGHGGSPGGAEGPFRSMLYAVDVLALLAAVPSVLDADAGRIFAYGHSMGGDVTLRVLEATRAIRAATLWAPVSAPFPESVLYYARRRGGDEARAQLARINAQFAASDYPRLSALDNVALIRAPLLLHHGTSDADVPYAWSATLAERLEAAGVTFNFLTYEGENHNLSRHSFATVLSRDVAFFRAHM